MSLIELLLTAVALSMDAFAVSMCKGLGMKRLNRKNAAIISLFFGGFQAAMPLLGWLLGRQFARLITSLDHWVAFGLLGFIGGKMIYDALRGGDTEGDACEKLNYRELVMLAFATSIDALAVGITLSLLTSAICLAVALIGLITFGLSFAGVYLGKRFGHFFESRIEVLGGLILIAIGLKILIQHLAE